MGAQVVTGVARFQSKTGIFQILKAENGPDKPRQIIESIVR